MKRIIKEPFDIFAFGENYTAKAKYLPDGRVKILAGSLMCPFATNSTRQSIVEMRNTILQRKCRQNCLLEDVVFENVSVSACVISGNMRSGNIFWQTTDNLPLAAYLEVDDYFEEEPKEEFFEGGRHFVETERIERNLKARKACLDHYGCKCQICGFDFKEAYGDDFDGIIQVHHIKPISESDDEHEVDPINDLIPVCPNCHVALHSKKGGVYLPSELKKLMGK